jgi:hypothetical protein
VVSSPVAPAEVSAEITGKVARPHQLHQGLEGRVDQASPGVLQGDIASMAANLSGLDGALAKRLALAEAREATMRRVLDTARTARRVSACNQAGAGSLRRAP